MEQPITQNQEWTLRNWVATFRRRPNKLEKTFLQADKGLSEGQIEAWLSKEENSSVIGGYPGQPPNDAKASPDDGFGLQLNALQSHGAMQANFDMANENLMDFLPSMAEPEIWSPASISTNTFSDSVQHDLWSNLGCHDSGLPTFEAPSLSETRALLSKPFNPHWTYMSDSSTNRSSCTSSMTWGTASSVSSFLDDYSEQGFPQPALFSSSNTIQEEPEDCYYPVSKHHLDTKALPPRPKHTKSKTKQPLKLENPTTSEKVSKEKEKTVGKFPCTACTSTFTRKGDWERHEDSRHDPQTHWTCMLGDPAIQVLTPSRQITWSCAFCDLSVPTRAEITEHLVHVHKIAVCTNRGESSRTWTRKDKLKQHLQQVHALADSAEGWKAWNRDVGRKFAWGCGYCGACSFTWEGRLSHIANHYEHPAVQLPPWSPSLVIKGLLKQGLVDFDVAGPWKRLVGGSSSERKLEWSSKDAALLKRRLEYRKGSADELVLEAGRLAMVLKSEPRTSADFKSTSMTNRPSGSERKIWPEAAGLGGFQPPSLPTSTHFVDTEMPDEMSYI